MARGKRRAPIQPSAPVPPDPVDDFVAQRHKVMLHDIRSPSSDSTHTTNPPDPDLRDRPVLDLALSSDSSDSDSTHEAAPDEWQERAGWGPRKRAWYGDDTHEYEIMDADERDDALRDEEEEAMRMRAETMSRLVPADFVGEEEEEEEEEEAEEADADVDADVDAEKGETGIGRVGERDAGAVEVVEAAAPEVPLLIAEMAESRRQAAAWKKRVAWSEVARLVYHLHASFIINVAYYLALRTDPDAEGVDLRTHPVLVEILRVRQLLKEAVVLPCEKPGFADGRGREQEAGEVAVAVAVEVEKENRTASAEKDGVVDVAKANGGLHENGLALAVAGGDGKRKRKKRKQRTKAGSERARFIAEDEDRLNALLPPSEEAVERDESVPQRRKARKLNQLVGAMERERKNDEAKHPLSADLEVVRQEPKRKTKVDFDLPEGADGELEFTDVKDDEAAVEKMLAKKVKKDARKARKTAESTAHVYTFKENVEGDARRRASTQVIKNRGLTRYRPKDKKTPRTKNRLSYSKAVVRRKGAVRDYEGTPGGSYAGEKSGINMSSRKGSRLSNV